MALAQWQKDNLPKICEAAIAMEIQLHAPGGALGDLVTAQCILESRWLKAAPGNNCFGVKEYVGAFGRQFLMTRENFTPKQLAWFLHLGDGRKAELVDPSVPADDNGRREYRVWDWFATFPDLAACFAKRAFLFRQGDYNKALVQYAQDKNTEAYITAVAKVYATSPIYAQTCMSILRMREVQDALYDARQAVEKQFA